MIETFTAETTTKPMSNATTAAMRTKCRPEWVNRAKTQRANMICLKRIMRHKHTIRAHSSRSVHLRWAFLLFVFLSFVLTRLCCCCYYGSFSCESAIWRDCLNQRFFFFISFHQKCVLCGTKLFLIFMNCFIETWTNRNDSNWNQNTDSYAVFENIFFKWIIIVIIKRSVL